jgi:antitoxin YefM
MSIKTTISITEARKNIFDIAEDVQKSGVYYTLTENGRPKAVLMSAEEFESWAETLDIMQEFPDLKNEIAEIDRAVKKGEYKKWPTLADLLNDYGYVIADKGKNNYAISIKAGAKRDKTAKKNTAKRSK